MIKPLFTAHLLVALCGLLTACGDSAGRSKQPPARKNAAVAKQATADCVPPALAVDDSDAAFREAFAEGSAALRQTRSNFSAAYARACAKPVLKDKLTSSARDRMLLFNAPDANVASIYPRDGVGVVVEFPFVTGDGAVNIPSAQELEEALYCAVHGASEQEQASSGRCLPD